VSLVPVPRNCHLFISSVVPLSLTREWVPRSPSTVRRPLVYFDLDSLVLEEAIHLPVGLTTVRGEVGLLGPKDLVVPLGVLVPPLPALLLPSSPMFLTG
jgi:hypothetical protein